MCRAGRRGRRPGLSRSANCIQRSIGRHIDLHELLDRGCFNVLGSGVEPGDGAHDVLLDPEAHLCEPNGLGVGDDCRCARGGGRNAG